MAAIPTAARWAAARSAGHRASRAAACTRSPASVLRLAIRLAAIAPFGGLGAKRHTRTAFAELCEPLCQWWPHCEPQRQLQRQPERRLQPRQLQSPQLLVLAQPLVLLWRRLAVRLVPRLSLVGLRLCQSLRLLPVLRLRAVWPRLRLRLRRLLRDSATAIRTSSPISRSTPMAATGILAEVACRDRRDAGSERSAGRPVARFARLRRQRRTRIQARQVHGCRPQLATRPG